jgi:hypothetical protein
LRGSALCCRSNLFFANVEIATPPEEHWRLLRNCRVTASRSLAKQSIDLSEDGFTPLKAAGFAMTRFFQNEVRGALMGYSQ